MSSNETIVVESTAPTVEVVAALTRASERIMLVGEDGREHREDELGDGGVGVYTPNYVSDVTCDESGRPGFYIDCRGAIEPEMAEGLLAVSGSSDSSTPPREAFTHLRTRRTRSHNVPGRHT